MKYYLSVPYEEKDIAQNLGAKWDNDAKLWYTHAISAELMLRWPLKIIPYKELPGEDRKFGGKALFVDLIPRSCWFTNVRYCIAPEDWDALRRYIYLRAGYRCECCGIDGDLEAHERWHYDEAKGVQKLMRLIALCRDCHESTHMGLAEIRGKAYFAKRHLMRVTGKTEQEADVHIDQAFKEFEKRSQINWALDLSIIEATDLKIVKPTDELDRSKISEEQAAYAEAKRNNTQASYSANTFKQPSQQPLNQSSAPKIEIPAFEKLTLRDDKPNFLIKKIKQFFTYHRAGLFGICVALIGLVIFLTHYPEIMGRSLTPFVIALLIFIFFIVALEACRRNLAIAGILIGIGIMAYFLANWHIFNVYHYLAPEFMHIITIIGFVGILWHVIKKRQD